VKFWHALVGLVLFLVLVVVAAGLIYLPIARYSEWAKVLSVLGNQPWLAACAGAALLALVLLFMVTGSPRREPQEQYLSFQNEGGTVSISIRAVRDFIARLGSEFAAISSLQPTLQARGGALYVELDVKVRSGTQVPELCRLLQDRVRESIAGSFGLSEVKAVKVNVREIVGAPPAEARDDRDTESGQFTG
jgi:hypothetical protein